MKVTIPQFGILIACLGLVSICQSMPTSGSDGRPRPKSRYGKGFFVKWDDKKPGGRWFECDVSKGGTWIKTKKDPISIILAGPWGWIKPASYFSVTAHDGDSKNFFGDQISYAGDKSQVGDQVLAYYYDKGTHKNAAFAYKGVHVETRGNEIYVRYDDGDEAWEDASEVHKLVLLEKGAHNLDYFMMYT